MGRRVRRWARAVCPRRRQVVGVGLAARLARVRMFLFQVDLFRVVLDYHRVFLGDQRWRRR